MFVVGTYSPSSAIWRDGRFRRRSENCQYAAYQALILCTGRSPAAWVQELMLAGIMGWGQRASAEAPWGVSA